VKGRKRVVESKTAEYFSWTCMRRRCSYLNDKSYARYGGRGITVCDRWLEYRNFLEDMGRKPSPRHSIERIDNNGDYRPDNCRWALPVEQQNNRCDNHILEYNGESLTLEQWGRRFGLTGSVIRFRLNLGWSIEEAITLPRVKSAGGGGRKFALRTGLITKDR
jgi:hypothetical protein